MKYCESSEIKLSYFFFITLCVILKLFCYRKTIDVKILNESIYTKNNFFFRLNIFNNYVVFGTIRVSFFEMEKASNSYIKCKSFLLLTIKI